MENEILQKRLIQNISVISKGFSWVSDSEAHATM